MSGARPTLRRSLRAVLGLYWRSQRRRLALGAALATVTVIAGIALLGLSGWFIAAAAIAGLSAASALAFDVFTPSAGIRLLALGRTAARYGERLATHDATFAVLAELRERAFRGWARPGAARLLLLRPARLLFRLTGDIDALDSLYLRILVPAAAATGAGLVTGVTLGLVSPWLGLAATAWLLLAGLGAPTLAARRALAPARRRASGLETLRQRVIDLAAGQTDLVMTGRLEAAARAVAAADARLARADDAINRAEAGLTAVFGVAGAVLLSGVLLAAALLAEHGAIGAPVAAMCALVALAALEPFAALRRGAMELGRTLLALGRLAPRLAGAQEQETQEPPAPEPGFAVQLEGVSLRHAGAARPTLRDVTFAVAAGERVALTGPSGAGKSTLLALLAGELSPAAGVARRLPSGLLTQRTELFQDTLRDNLRLAAPEADDARLMQALEAAGLGAVVRRLPGGLDAMLGEGGAGLSGGQARRLALARLLLRDAPLWLLDEPTEALDAGAARATLACVDSLAAGRALVIATHLRREAELADRLAVMEGGRIVFQARRGEPAFDALLAGLRPD
ncbi:thiol reductant ABC exporter subunit CydC [Camelimonas abortus]|uniref:Thiol reductant ABC exporter subunit CydC n=1 Tax=Camelimonas abortus TaxID=1017184 RepID=A0ABV7LBW5_9HYPH